MCEIVRKWAMGKNILSILGQNGVKIGSKLVQMASNTSKGLESQFSSQTLVTLKFYVFFIDVQMILVSFFDIPNQKSVNQEKTNLSYQTCILYVKDKIGFSWFTDFWLGISKKAIGNQILKSLGNKDFKFWVSSKSDEKKTNLLYITLSS